MATELVYTGNGTRAPGVPLPPDIDTWPDPPEQYVAAPSLVDAVNSALFLEQPLLLMGEPGTGKTQLAYSLAWELGLPLYRFNTKMNSAGQDLFYHYDSLLHFYDMQIRKKRYGLKRYVSYAALGRAILDSNEPAQVAEYLPARLRQTHTAARRAVVLIDEIDKASRDFPNDILAETERYSFEVRETGWKPIAANRERAPIVVITSNQERNLPEAFLRRCIYYYITFPEESELRTIVQRRLGGPDATAAIQKFLQIRDNDQLQKKPATAELLAWVKLLRKKGIQTSDLKVGTPLMRQTYPALLKTKDDLERYLRGDERRAGHAGSAR